MELTPAQTAAGLVATNAGTLAEEAYDPSAEAWFIFNNDKPVGLVAFIDMGHPEVELAPGDDPEGFLLWRLFIAAEHQRKGYGSSAVKYGLERAAALGRPRFYVEASSGAQSPIRFYERFGFRPTGRKFDEAVEFVCPV